MGRMMSYGIRLLQGDSLEILKTLPDSSIDCCVTSPPYYGLRDYGADGQIGLEKTPEEYINKLVHIFSEVRRVLKDSGTLWINIGDSYAGSGKGAWRNKTAQKETYVTDPASPAAKMPKQFEGIKPKDLIGIPWMLAFALRRDGWYLRNDIIWYKPNAMPESVKDRCAKSYEHIFLLSKSRKYYFDWEAIKEPCVGFDKSSPRGSKGTLTPNAGRRRGNSKSFRGGGAYTDGCSFNNSADNERKTHGNLPNGKGTRNKRDVWSVATKGCKDAHFATFPQKLIEPCVLAGSRSGGIVLDPFLGSGTTAIVASKHQRQFIGIELNCDYIEIAKRRIAKEL